MIVKKKDKECTLLKEMSYEFCGTEYFVRVKELFDLKL